MTDHRPTPTLSFDRSTATLTCSGSWTVSTVSPIVKQTFEIPPVDAIKINGSRISHMDTSGAWALQQVALMLKEAGKKISFSGFLDEHVSLFDLVETAVKKSIPSVNPPTKHSLVYLLGENVVTKSIASLDIFAFFGEIATSIGQIIKQPAKLQFKSFLNVIDETGYRALPIVGLLCFLIGVVLTYQTGEQLKAYGANIYIISLLGIAMLQEFGPLITAIIVAGRTSSAFTAQIGTMLINEEIDALRTMGLSPVIRLVIPKILGLMLVFPLLILWADIFGLLGGMIVADKMLGVNYYTFLRNFPEMIDVQTLLNGLIKGPFFAAIVAGVGCYRGFQVISTADSVGQQTTKSVVQSIFWIIVADAIFSIVLPWQEV